MKSIVRAICCHTDPTLAPSLVRVYLTLCPFSPPTIYAAVVPCGVGAHHGAARVRRPEHFPYGLPAQRRAGVRVREWAVGACMWLCRVAYGPAAGPWLLLEIRQGSQALALRAVILLSRLSYWCVREGQENNPYSCLPPSTATKDGQRTERRHPRQPVPRER